MVVESRSGRKSEGPYFVEHEAILYMLTHVPAPEYTSLANASQFYVWSNASK